MFFLFVVSPLFVFDVSFVCSFVRVSLVSALHVVSRIRSAPLLRACVCVRSTESTLHTVISDFYQAYFLLACLLISGQTSIPK